MKEKKQLTPQELYKKNLSKAKVYKKIAPIVYWVFIGLTIIFVYFTLKNSFGNVREVMSMLDKDTHTGEEVAENYRLLVEKYGEWEVIGQGGNSLVIRFVDIRKVFFGGIMVTFSVLAVTSFIMAIICGKLLFPKLAILYSENNQDMVNMATLETNQKIKDKKEWF